MSVKNFSLNVRGIRDPVKRKAIFNFYKKRGQIICLQETHSVPSDEEIWASEFHGDAIFSHGTSNARGVCILLPKGLKELCTNTYRDNIGRVIKTEIQLYNHNITLCNIYAPNKDSPSFFQDLQKTLEIATEHLIILGDFNLVMDVNRDRIGSINSKTKSREILLSMCDELYLSEIWRTKNPDLRHYSWYKFRPKLAASRIDFALTSQGLIDKCDNVGYLTGLNSDHLAFYLFLQLQKNRRGAGYWKLNISYLSNVDYVDMMNRCLDTVLSSYHEENILKKWEYLKYKVREESIYFSKQFVSERELIIAQLSEKVTEMEHNITTANIDILKRSKLDLESIMQEKTKECIFRSKARFAELGEKPTKYFFNLEKSRFNARTCDALYDEENGNKLVTDTKGILALQERYYQKLYTKDDKINFVFENTYGVTVSSKLKEEMNMPFSEDEISKAVQQLPNGKTCGNDGIPIDFYKVFWIKIKHIFCAVIEKVYKDQKLYDSALLGVINLIPKQKKDTRYLKFLRPITLLNSCYKVIEKAVANRLEPALEEIISVDQRGFLKNRRIASNIRTILELMKYTESNQMDAMILSLDFLKCFDMIDHSAIMGALKFFDFPVYMIRWIGILYNGFKANTQNNGHFSNRFAIQRGVHQGGPCSSLIFLICAETMALLIKNHPDIKGIPVAEMLNLLGQYADDADMYLLKDQKSLDSVFTTLEKFRGISGFTLIYDKTSIMRIGSMKDSDSTLITQRVVAWTKEPVNVLGVWLSPNIDEITRLNYEEIYKKAQTVISKWCNRSLSLHGKVLVINNLITSLFVYRMTVLPSMPVDLVKNLRSMIIKFIWNNARPKIGYETLIMHKSEGGLGLIDLVAKDKALKVSWINILIREPKLESLVYENCCPELRNLIWQCSLHSDEVSLFIRDPFWQSVFETWFLLQALESTPQMHLCGQEIIWLNSRIRVGNKPILWRKCLRKQLVYISQLYKDGVIINADTAKNFGLSRMDLNSLISAIPKEWKRNLTTNIVMAGEIESFYEKMRKKSNVSNYVYWKLIKHSSMINKSKKWELELQCEIPYEDFLRCFKDIYSVTNIAKYRSFQYRLLHRAIITNVDLKRWNIILSELCTFCGKEKEDYKHLFIYCEFVRNLWIQVRNLLNLL